MRFQNKIALVTGAASGIGAATALKLAQEGAQVIVADIDMEGGEWVVSQIRAQGEAALFQRVDLADENSIKRCAAAVAQRVPSLHILINNAGIIRLCSIATTGHEDWDAQVAINLRAPALMAQALLPLMQKEGGAIVNVSSDGAFRPMPNRWVYDATKAGICALTRTMAAEFFRFGIRANAVAPGWIVTEMHFGQAPDPQARKKELENLKIGTTMQRLGRPHEVANAIAFLASDEASYITATILHVDGGLGLG